MSKAHHIPEDKTRLSTLDRLYFKLESGLNLIGGLVIFLLVIFATINILGRWIFDLPISGYIDWIEQAMAFFAFLGIAYTQREGEHIRMDMVVRHLHDRKLWITELVSSILMLIITLILIYGSWLHFLRAYQIGDSSLDINLPTWPSKLVIPIALSVLAIRLIIQIWAYARALKNPEDLPVAVPVIKDPAMAASQEAELLMRNKD